MATCPAYLTGYLNGIYYYSTINCTTLQTGTTGSPRPLQTGCTAPNSPAVTDVTRSRPGRPRPLQVAAETGCIQVHPGMRSRIAARYG